MNPAMLKCVLAALATVALVACQQQTGTPPAATTGNPPAPGAAAPAASAAAPASTAPTPAASIAAPATSTAAPAASVPAPASSGAPPAAAASTGAAGGHVATQPRIKISLPDLPAGEQPLADVLHMAAKHAKRDFLQTIPNPKQHPEFAGRQFELLLGFKIAANTTAFTSVRETGESDTGGAHPLPIEAAFVFDRKAGKLIGLDDLFSKPDAARKALAGFAHAALLKKLMANAPGPGEGSPKALQEWKKNTLRMLDQGTKPTRANFSLFVVRAGTTTKSPSPGLTLIFPPYQAAAYVYGTQTVAVPVRVFAKFLKHEYRDDFVKTGNPKQSANKRK